MTTQVTDFHNPTFALFPINNDRTAWRPVNKPVILVEPDRRDPLGNPIELSQVSNVRIAIEDVPQQAVVAGHDNVGLLYPEKELFAVTISTTELYDRLIEPNGQPFFRPDGTPIAFEDAQLGDFMQYTTRSGVRDTITYIPSANYYDLSDFFVEVEELPPDYYFMTYLTDFQVRVVSDQDELICIDGSQQATAVLRNRINHPGQTMEEQVRHTPQPYFTKASKAEDSTIAFYRPFTDALQDLFDESALLEKVNWVDKVPPDFVPYLAFLLGLDIPFFPESVDNLRRVMLRNIVRLQQLKGSRRALIDLFNLFGFSIFLINLYWSKNGCRLIRPGEDLPEDFEDQEIQIIEACQIEPVLAEYNTDGFGNLVVPLLYRPTQTQVIDGIATRVEGGTVTVDGFLVEEGSTAHAQLQAIVEASNQDPDGYGESVGCNLPPVTGSGIIGFSEITLDSLTGEATGEIQAGVQPPFSSIGTRYQLANNLITITFNGAILFETPNLLRPSGANLVLYAFATYDRQEYIIPEELEGLQSNRFDIQILTRTGEQVAPDTLDFLIDFVFKIKAFHSLLNVVIYRVDLIETYEVTDWCVGGDVAQRYDTDAGRLQVPPAIIPRMPEDGECIRGPEDLGYKPEDIQLREFKLENLAEEHTAWRELDSRAGENPGIETSIYQPLDNPNRESCKFTDRGQDKILTEETEELKSTEFNPGPNANTPSVASELNLDESPVDSATNGEFDPFAATRTTEYDGYGSFNVEHTSKADPLCEEDGATDFCYKGRVVDELLHQERMVFNELSRCKPCSLGMGTGVYYTYPVPSVLVAIAKTGARYFSGQASQAGIQGYLESIQKSYLAHPYSIPLPSKNNSTLGRLLRAYDQPLLASLHFTNRRAFTDDNKKQTHFVAIQRPELDIEQNNLLFPGCRFPTMNRLENTYTSSEYSARPWDDQYSTYCGPDSLACATRPTFLNAELVENTNGDLVLSFDDVPFSAEGNGLTPDITSLSSQVVPYGLDWDSENDVIHKVYTNEFDGHPAISLDSVCPCSSTDEGTGAEGTLTSDGLIRVDDPLFSSAGECPAGDYLDFCDGYACERGFQDRGDTDIDRDGLYEELFDALGIPRTSDPTDADSLFRLTSGIRVTTGTRLDCGCTVLECSDNVTVLTEPTGQLEGEALPCIIDQFVDQEGERDWECDKIIIETNLVLEEQFGAHCDRLDGSIPTLFELKPGCCSGSGTSQVVG